MRIFQKDGRTDGQTDQFMGLGAKHLASNTEKWQRVQVIPLSCSSNRHKDFFQCIMKFCAACKYCGSVGHMVKPAGDPAGDSATSVPIGYPRLFSTVAIPQLQFHACQQAVCMRFAGWSSSSTSMLRFMTHAMPSYRFGPYACP